MKMPLQIDIDYAEMFKLIERNGWSIWMAIVGFLSFIAYKWWLPILKLIYEARRAEAVARKLQFDELEKKVKEIELRCEKDKAKIQEEVNNMKVSSSAIFGMMQGLELNLQKIGINIKPHLEEFKDKLNL